MIGVFGRRERPALVTLAALLALLAVVAPAFFGPANLRDVVIANAIVQIIAVGMTAVILTGHIDVSVGATAGVCAVIFAALAKAGLPTIVAAAVAAMCGALAGLAAGVLVTRAKLPSIVVTLALLVILRDGLRWVTGGAWVGELPAGFQWFGLSQAIGQALVIVVTAATVAAGALVLGRTAFGRSLHAAGSHRESAQLLGLSPDRATIGAFAALGLLTGVAAAINASRFAEVPGAIVPGLELKVIAAVIVGGTSIAGGRGSIAGTVLGVALLGVIGTGLTFLGVSAYWERALQGAIILAAILYDSVARRQPSSHPPRPPLEPVAAVSTSGGGPVA